MIAPQPHPFSLFQMNKETYILKNMLELRGITTLTYVIVRESKFLYGSQSWDNKCHIHCPEGVSLMINMWAFYGSFYQIYRSSRSNTISQSGVFILIRALTLYILEVHKLLEEVILPYWDSFARIRGSTFLKLAFIEDSIESRSRRSKYVLMTVVALFFP
jgi:hypothetical protein